MTAQEAHAPHEQQISEHSTTCPHVAPLHGTMQIFPMPVQRRPAFESRYRIWGVVFGALNVSFF